MFLSVLHIETHTHVSVLTHMQQYVCIYVGGEVVIKKLLQSVSPKTWQSPYASAIKNAFIEHCKLNSKWLEKVEGYEASLILSCYSLSDISSIAAVRKCTQYAL